MIQLKRKEVPIPQAVISAMSRRPVILSSGGRCVPGIPLVASYPQKVTYIGNVNGFTEWGSFGRVLHSDSPVVINNIDFKAICYFDSIILRTTVYGFGAYSMLVPLSAEVYTLMKKSKRYSLRYRHERV